MGVKIRAIFPFAHVVHEGLSFLFLHEVLLMRMLCWWINGSGDASMLLYCNQGLSFLSLHEGCELSLTQRSKMSGHQ